MITCTRPTSLERSTVTRLDSHAVVQLGGPIEFQSRTRSPQRWSQPRARLAGRHHMADWWILGTGRPLFVVRLAHHRPRVGRGRAASGFRSWANPDGDAARGHASPPRPELVDSSPSKSFQPGGNRQAQNGHYRVRQGRHRPANRPFPRRLRSPLREEGTNHRSRLLGRRDRPRRAVRRGSGGGALAGNRGRRQDCHRRDQSAQP
jgi:hypothetical protein